MPRKRVIRRHGGAAPRDVEGLPKEYRMRSALAAVELPSRSHGPKVADAARSSSSGGSENLMRIFLAVFPPRETVALAAGVIETLRRAGDGVSWVKEPNLHYTLRFIGEAGADGARRIDEAAREAAAGEKRFEAALGTAGAFPSARKARVIWLGMAKGAEPLVKLATALEASLARHGFAPEGRPFSAHLTLGRVREPGRDWTADLAAIRAPEGAAARFTVDAIAVVESQLSPKGSTYTVRARGELAG